jgi:hypothetical protein
MDPRLKASILWGIVGGLAFLTLVQGYELVAGAGVDAVVKALGAVAVTLVATIATHLMRPRLYGNESP